MVVELSSLAFAFQWRFTLFGWRVTGTSLPFYCYLCQKLPFNCSKERQAGKGRIPVHLVQDNAAQPDRTPIIPIS